MKLALIFESERPETTGVYIERALRSLGVACDRWRLRDAAAIPPEYAGYLRVDHGDEYEVRLPAVLRPSVFYAIDTHLPHSWKKIRRMASAYDLVACAQADAAARLPGAVWLPFACDPEVHAAPPAAPVWDLAFVGTEGGVPRKFLLQALRERYPNSRIGAAPFREMGALYSQARIGFNYSIADDLNMRVFEVLAAGAALVTNALRQDGLRRLGLEDGRHLRLYRGPRDLMAVIDELLADEPQRRRLADAGRREALERHTYAHRIAGLLEQMRRRLNVQLNARELPTCTSS